MENGLFLDGLPIKNTSPRWGQIAQDPGAKNRGIYVGEHGKSRDNHQDHIGIMGIIGIITGIYIGFIVILKDCESRG